MWEGAARATATCGSSRTARQFPRRWPQGVFLLPGRLCLGQAEVEKFDARNPNGDVVGNYVDGNAVCLQS